MALTFYRTQNMIIGHCQLARSLERILEDAQVSGELRLSNRKLKDFPRAAMNCDLTDTVIADLSRNRFCELPEEITSYAFLETLFLYHNTIRSISQSVKGLISLTYLDLRSNHLISLPRELCSLPLQVLLLAHNRLTSLPDEFGRMNKLTDLDVSCNQIVSLPTKFGDLKNLRSLSLRCNQLTYLPKDITSLSLISLDISNNRISSLPIEIRQMAELVTLKLENNPLSSPPASLCVRGLVHIIKYLDLQAGRDERVKPGSCTDGFSTFRRIQRSNVNEDNKIRRYHIDSGYCTSDGLDKRWLLDTAIGVLRNGTWFPSEENTSTNPENLSGATNKTIDTVAANGCDYTNNLSYIANLCSENLPTNGNIRLEEQKGIGKNKPLYNIQTYREYKEALKQQRSQDSSNVYRKKFQQKNLNNIISHVCNVVNIDNTHFDYVSQDTHSPKVNIENNICANSNSDEIFGENMNQLRKPVQKVPPSRNIKRSMMNEEKSETDNECHEYIKPRSPIKSNGLNSANHKIVPNKEDYAIKSQKAKSTRNVSWNQDASSEKLSFTMRREFDKQKEETELIAQLRNIIETCLKMNLPQDIAASLTDGVILCHLANYIRPRSVASIHVPSPGVPKLTMARCRRNVDNFLEACRKIGVVEELIRSCADVFTDKEIVSGCLFKLQDVHASVLLNEAGTQQFQQGDLSTSATNSIIGQLGIKHILSSISDKRGIASLKIGEMKLKYSGDTDLKSDYIDRTRFLCFCKNLSINYEKQFCCCNSNSLTCKSNRYITFNTINSIQKDLDINKTNKVDNLKELNNSSRVHNLENLNNFIVNDSDNFFTKRIGLIESSNNNYNMSNFGKKVFSIYKPSLECQKLSSDKHSLILTIFLSCIFSITFILLIIFPLPN